MRAKYLIRLRIKLVVITLHEDVIDTWPVFFYRPFFIVARNDNDKFPIPSPL